MCPSPALTGPQHSALGPVASRGLVPAAPSSPRRLGLETPTSHHGCESGPAQGPAEGTAGGRKSRLSGLLNAHAASQHTTPALPQRSSLGRTRRGDHRALPRPRPRRGRREPSPLGSTSFF